MRLALHRTAFPLTGLKGTNVLEARFVASLRIADNPGVDIATSGLSDVDYGAENGAGNRWV
ncbi:MAG: hypothetical protein QOE96_3900 [Blastocatellia bacterium]|nr:hypothetical protein [Blastocatellia bacterium]